jgi:hypothetical protein
LICQAPPKQNPPAEPFLTVLFHLVAPPAKRKRKARAKRHLAYFQRLTI